MSKGTPPVAVRLAPELRDRLAMLAYARGVALSDVIREALTEYVDRAESQSALSESASLSDMGDRRNVDHPLADLAEYEESYAAPPDPGAGSGKGGSAP
jgi:predicted transcriptional regulator